MSRLPHPMRQRAKTERARREDRIRRRSKAIVAVRVERNQGRCEGCGRVLPLDWAHIFGRGSTGLKLGEKYASDPDLCAGLCRGPQGCHSKHDEHKDEAFSRRLEWRAVTNFGRHNGWDAAALAAILGTDDPADVIREMVRRLEKDAA